MTSSAIRRSLIAVAILAGATVFVPAGASRAQDASDIVVRLSQLEDQMRQMSGKIEELQYQNQQLRDELQKFREDTEFRFQDMGKGSGRAPAPHAEAPPPPAPAAPPRQIASATPGSPRQIVRGDVYDPQADPNEPGAPRQLGSPERSLPPSVRRGGAEDGVMEEPDGAPGTPMSIAGAASPPPGQPPQPRPPSQASIAATSTNSDRADFDNAYSYMQQHQYEQAEMGFRSFLQSHPRSRLVADATYWLGESYLERSRYRDAAEQFLKITTTYGTSPKGAEGMFKLGVSLHGLGANDQACATFAEIGHKYPSARPALLKEVQHEQQRAKCPS